MKHDYKLSITQDEYKGCMLNAELIFEKHCTALYKQNSIAFLGKHIWLLIKELAFVHNPYDSCVVNKDIEGKQCTVLWHVDDLKIFHVASNIVSQIIEKLEERYGLDALHTDMRNYTGAVLSLGTGGVYSMSVRQKINTKCSTEAELVEVDDAMPLIICTENFTEAQG